jgi:hypothetical protein
MVQPPAVILVIIHNQTWYCESSRLQNWTTNFEAMLWTNEVFLQIVNAFFSKLFEEDIVRLNLVVNEFAYSTLDLSRRHHLHSFSQKLRCQWENIWRKVVHINHLNNVSSNIFQNMLSGLADDRLEQTTSSALIISKPEVWIGKYLKKSCQYWSMFLQIFSIIKIAAKSANWVSLPWINFRAKIFLHVWFEFYRQWRSHDYRRRWLDLSASAPIEFIWWFCRIYSVNSITYRIIFSYGSYNDQWGRFCSVIAAFRWFCMLIVCWPESCCMCVYNMHARSSADSFAVGSGVWSVFVMFSLAYFGTQSRILSPRKDTLRACSPNILAAKIFAYTVCYKIQQAALPKIQNCVIGAELNVVVIRRGACCPKVGSRSWCVKLI